MYFAWDDWNVAHIAKHDVHPTEAEYVVSHASAPWPEEKGDGKYAVWGATAFGRLLQVIFTVKRPEDVSFEVFTVDQWADLAENARLIYIVHAMELNDRMKRNFRRRRRSS